MIEATTPITAARSPGRALAIVAAACAAVGSLGLVVEPKTTWSGFLVAFALFSGLAVAGPLFLSIHHLTGARWSTPLLPVAAALARTLPVAAILGVLLLGGVPSLYEWAHPEAVATDRLLTHKAPWLNVPGFAIRMVLYFAVWIWAGARVVRAGAPGCDRAVKIRRSALFMAAFGITFSLACVDWFQSLEPHWFSTIYALLHLAGVATSGLAVVMITAVVLRRAGAIGRDDDQLADLGKVALSLALFWAYVKFCQWMLIWYTNVPEETPWYVMRSPRGWMTIAAASFCLNWAVPFFVLMPRAARRSESVILRVAIIMLLGRLVELHVLIMPPLSGPQPGLSLFDVAPVVGAMALFAWSFLRGLRVAP